jgi:hypothetical protein
MWKYCKQSIVFKGAAIFLAFVLVMPGYPAFAQTNNNNLLLPSAPYDPPVLRGIKFDPADPLKFDFIIYEGQNHLGKAALEEESAKLIRYFLAGLTIPEEDLWVNLSPYEHDKIAPQEFSQTDIGKEMLAQDYLLKQLAASLTYPETEAGKLYWEEINGVGARSPRPGRGNPAPTNSFNKVWIMPQEVVIFQDKDRAFVKDIKFKVMMEEDYVAMNKNGRFDTSRSLSVPPKAGSIETNGTLSDRSANAFRKHILPLIEKEVNTGKNFASLRQLTCSIMLAVWFKGKLKESIINKIYSDKKKIKGIETNDPAIKEKIYQQYLEAFQKGAYNYVKRESVTPYGGNSTTASSRAFALIRPSLIKITRRHYFSGGVVDGEIDGVPAHESIVKNARPVDSASSLERGEIAANTHLVTARLGDVNVSPSVTAAPAVNTGFQKAIGNEIDRQIKGLSASGKVGNFREAFGIFHAAIDSALVSNIGIGPNGDTFYRLVVPDKGEVIIAVDKELGTATFVALRDDRVISASWEGNQSSRSYQILPDSLKEEFSLSLLTFLKQKGTGTIPDESKEYNNRVDFSLINPYVDKEKILAWYQQYPLFRRVLDLVSQKPLRYKLCNRITIMRDERRHEGAVVQEGPPQVLLEKGVLVRSMWERSLFYDPVKIMRLVAHELAHVALRQLNRADIARLARGPLAAMRAMIAANPAYIDYPQEWLDEEPFAYSFDALVVDKHKISVAGSDDVVTAQAIAALKEIGLLEDSFVLRNSAMQKLGVGTIERAREILLAEQNGNKFFRGGAVGDKIDRLAQDNTLGSGVYLTDEESAGKYAIIRGDGKGEVKSAVVVGNILDISSTHQLPEGLLAGWREVVRSLCVEDPNEPNRSYRVGASARRVIEFIDRPGHAKLALMVGGALQQYFSDFLQSKGYDGMKAWEGGEAGMGLVPWEHISVIVFKSENVIPSERLNSLSPEERQAILPSAPVVSTPAPAALPIVENGFLYRERLNAALNQAAEQVVDSEGHKLIDKVFVAGSALFLDKDGKVALDAIDDLDVIVICSDYGRRHKGLEAKFHAMLRNVLGRQEKSILFGGREVSTWVFESISLYKQSIFAVLSHRLSGRTGIFTPSEVKLLRKQTQDEQDLKYLKRYAEIKLLVDGDTSARDELLAALAAGSGREARLKALKAKVTDSFETGGERGRLLGHFRLGELKIAKTVDRILSGAPAAPLPIPARVEVASFLKAKMDALLADGNKTVLSENDWAGLRGPAISENVLRAVYALLEKHHAGQMRKNAVPSVYLVHPLGVAAIAMRLGVTSREAILAALLHDVLEDSVMMLKDGTRKGGKYSLPDTDIGTIRAIHERIADEIKQALVNAGALDEEINVDEVIRLAQAVTQIKGSSDSAYHEQIAAAGKVAVTIKTADIIYNLRDLATTADQKAIENILAAVTQLFSCNNFISQLSPNALQALRLAFSSAPVAVGTDAAPSETGGIDLAHAAKKIKSQGKEISLTSSAPQIALDEQTFSGFTFTILATSKVTSTDMLFR